MKKKRNRFGLTEDFGIMNLQKSNDDENDEPPMMIIENNSSSMETALPDSFKKAIQNNILRFAFT